MKGGKEYLMNNSLSFFKGIRDDIKIRRHIKKNLPQELLYMKGKLSVSNSDKSILYLTVHRCASQYILSIIKKLIAESDKKHIDVGSYFWRGGKPYREPEKVFEKHGYIFGPFYGFDEEEFTVPIPNLDDFNILLMLRDPRDILTSFYFHHAYELYDNPAKKEFILERSRDTLSKTIDDWVIEKSAILKYRYKAYLDIAEKPNVLLLKYEDMIKDFNSWLDTLSGFLNVNVSAGTLNNIRQKADFSVQKEKVDAHKRQVAPGDHKRKLKEETIGILNSEFGEILAKLDYQ